MNVVQKKAYPSDTALLDVLRYDLRDAEILIKWQGDVFIGKLASIDVKREINTPVYFTITGFIDD